MPGGVALPSGYWVWGHGGNAPGYAAGMLYLPDYGVVVSLMDNTSEALRRGVRESAEGFAMGG